MKRNMIISAALLATVTLLPAMTGADETCNSPYMSKLIKGQEKFVHVWTLGVEGMGDGSDKLVTVDVDPKSKSYGKVVHSLAVGSRGEAHHMGFPDDRRYLWAGGLENHRIYVFDVGPNPARPKLVRTMTDLAAKSGYVGPHTFYAMPGRRLIGALSNAKDSGGVTGLALHNNKGEFIANYDLPKGEMGSMKGDGPLVAQARWQLGCHSNRAHLKTLARQTGCQGRVARQGSRHHWRSCEDPTARRYFNHRGRQGIVGQHLFRRHDALLRLYQSRNAQGNLREENRPSGKHDLAELGRQARLHHIEPVGALGQDRRRQRVVPAYVQLGWKRTEARIRGGFHQGKTGARASHEVQRELS